MTHTLAKIVDGRKPPIRGCRGAWVRHECYAQITVENIQLGAKKVRRVPLIGSSGEPANTVAQEVAEIGHHLHDHCKVGEAP